MNEKKSKQNENTSIFLADLRNAQNPIPLRGSETERERERVGESGREWERKRFRTKYTPKRLLHFLWTSGLKAFSKKYYGN